MWLKRFLAVLAVVMIFGCGPREEKQAVEPAGNEQIRPALEQVAESGVVDSGLMVVREELEKMQSTDAAKAQELLKDLEELESMSSPDQVRNKAKAMLGKL
jgi:hypothetical protein